MSNENDYVNSSAETQRMPVVVSKSRKETQRMPVIKSDKEED